MGIPNICAISGCDNPPLLAYAGQWICGECMVKWNDTQNKGMMKRMEEAVNGC